jgi:phosphomannomutase
MAMEKERIDLPPGSTPRALAAALERVAAAFPEARPDRLDGLRLDWSGGWLLVRASNTEPIVRVVAEAASAAEARAAIARAREAIDAAGAGGGPTAADGGQAADTVPA